MSGDAFDRMSAALEARAIVDVTAPAMAAAQLEAGIAIHAEVRRRAARHSRSGYMARRVTMHVDGRGFRQTVDIHAGGKVAHLVIGGTDAHAIRAHGRALPLIPFGTSPIGFARSVRHPGTRPDPFVAAGVAASSSEVQRALAGAGASIVKTLARNGD